MHHDLVGDIIHRWGQPLRPLWFNRIDCIAPLRHVLVQVRHQRDWLTEVHITLTQIAQFAQGANYLQQVLFFLGRPAQFVSIGADFHHVLVTDIHRHDRNGALQTAQHGLQGHTQGAGLRLQQTTGARTATFNKVFHRITARKKLRHIFTKYRRIQSVAFETAANEKGTATAENWPGREEVQVDPSGNVRRNQTLVIEHVRE